MANIVHINKPDCADSIMPRKGEEVPKGFRKATLQGSLLTMSPINPLPHTGGGMRGPQWGHDWRSEERIFRFLMTCHIPKYYWTFTFPKALGPEDSKKYMEKFAKKLAKNLTYGAVTKMEVQPGRLSGEFMMLLWTDGSIDKADIQDLWNKIIGEDGRIHFDFVDKNRWKRLAKYFSKKILIRPDMVQVGEKEYQVIASEDKTGYSIESMQDEKNVYLVRDSQNTSTPHALKPVSRELFRDWLHYSGRFVHKHNPKEIPRHEKKKVYIKDNLDNNFRNNHINPHRKEHFIGKNQGYSVALDFVKIKDQKYSKNFHRDNKFTDRIELYNKRKFFNLIERFLLIICRHAFGMIIYLMNIINNFAPMFK